MPAHGIYDPEVDTSITTPQECAAQIRARVESERPPETFRRLREVMREAQCVIPKMGYVRRHEA